MSLRYCLIGCGRVSRSHITAARNNALDIVALCDTDPGAAQENLGKMDVTDIPFYADYTAMLREIKPQLVAIATPSGLHAQMALDCLTSGAHVIIEKPIAMNMADAHRIAEAAEKTGLVAGVNLQNRFNPAVMELKRAVDAGRFGTIYNASMHLLWHRGNDYYNSAAWRGTKAQDGGAMMNQSIHGIDLLNWMLGGNPTEVTALTGTLARNIESEDLGLALLRYPGGTLANLTCTTLRYHGAEEQTLEINGERGCVRLGGSSAHVVETWRFDDNAPDEEQTMRRRYGKNPETVYGHGHSLHYADVLRAINENGRPLVDATEGSRALEIILGAYKSAEKGRSVLLHEKTS